MAAMETTNGDDREPFAPEDASKREDTRTRLERAALELQQKRAIAKSLRTEDLSLAERVRALGFDGDGARIFDLLPLVHVAWADGSIHKKERASILRVLSVRKVVPGTDAFLLIESLLEEPPGEAYIEETLDVIREILADKPARAEAIVKMCISVAEAAGGFLGFGNKISPEESATIERIANALGEPAQALFRQRL